MGKHIVIVHGRAVKPAKKPLANLAARALANGMRRAGDAAGASALEEGRVTFSSAYYGDVSNAILAAASRRERSKLSATDPDSGGAPCLPHEYLEEAYALTDRYKRFNKATYRRVLAAADDNRYLDEAADVASAFGALFTAGLLNKVLINAATRDMGAYLDSHDVGSTVRGRLDAVLRPALLGGDDVCLLTHSMGCIVAYDVLWKYSHMSEYAELRNRLASPVSRWITFGCPLGDLGVRRNLLDGRYRNEAEKYPRGRIVRNWINVQAEDDFVAHDEAMKPHYGSLVASGDIDSLDDRRIYNCWVFKDHETGELKSNPHDFYGYLMNPDLAGVVGEWIAAP
jgi:hypothetical protein